MCWPCPDGFPLWTKFYIFADCNEIGIDVSIKHQGRANDELFCYFHYFEVLSVESGYSQLAILTQ